MLQWLKCRFPWPYSRHQYEVIETYDHMTRKLKCRACGKYFAMSDRYMGILPWDDAIEQITRDIYGVPRSKI